MINHWRQTRWNPWASNMFHGSTWCSPYQNKKATFGTKHDSHYPILMGKCQKWQPNHQPVMITEIVSELFLFGFVMVCLSRHPKPHPLVRFQIIWWLWFRVILRWRTQPSLWFLMGFAPTSRNGAYDFIPITNIANTSANNDAEWIKNRMGSAAIPSQ